MRVRYTRQAVADLVGIADYIHLDSSSRGLRPSLEGDADIFLNALTIDDYGVTLCWVSDDHMGAIAVP